MTTQTEPITLDFSKQGGPVFVGRAQGEKARQNFRLDILDDSEDIIKVVIPEGTYSVNSSFFLGLFTKSVLKTGSKKKFLAKFNFVCESFLLETIDTYIDRALREKSDLF
ncbi:MAG: hypothetical protein HQL71_01145 [Magnetococcales bacterium]|nr:hypothetical protein [Magnetococcales bacterium]